MANDSVPALLLTLVYERGAKMTVGEILTAFRETILAVSPFLREGYLVPQALTMAIRDTKQYWVSGSAGASSSNARFSPGPEVFEEAGSEAGRRDPKQHVLKGGICALFNGASGCGLGVINGSCMHGKHVCAVKVPDARSPGNHRTCGSYKHGRSACPDKPKEGQRGSPGGKKRQKGRGH